MNNEPTFQNPIWHDKWKIYLSTWNRVWTGCDYEFCHDDYDGADDANDHRYGWAKSIEDAKEQIKEYEEDNQPVDN